MALTVIAILSISCLLFIKQTISNHDDDSRVVNVAGRQRMLSQRLTKLALLRVSRVPAADTVAFDSLLHTWQQTHIQLRAGILRMEKSYTVRKSNQLDSMFSQIEPFFRSINQSFIQINHPQTSLADKRAALQVLLRDELPFVQQMNDIVFQFDTESFERVRTLEQVEWGLTLATLLTLLLEGLFVFRPVVNHTKKVIYQLAESESALQEANMKLAITNQELENTNQHLLVANRQLVETQSELLRTTEEKYRLQRTEDKIRSGALLEGQEEERRRFARELHDGIGQMLTGLKLHTEKMKTGPFADEKQRNRYGELCDLIYDIIQTTRQISYNLMPATLSDFGLAATLQVLAEQSARASGLTIVFEGSTDISRFSPSTEIGLYRIAQEALNNAIKHANALTILIRLQVDNQHLVLSIEDNGIGFSVRNSTRKSKIQPAVGGLDNMRTRVGLLNGEFTITSKPRKGTIVTVRIDLPV